MSRARISNLWCRIAIVLVVCCLMTAGLSVNTAMALDGSGTEGDPWRIQSLEDFNDFAADANYWDDYTRLETDVNLAGRTYSTPVVGVFTGVFDGNDHKIINLTIDDGGAGNDYLGLFGYIGEDGEVRNLGLQAGSVVSGDVSDDVCVGGLVGTNDGSLLNCYSTCDVNGVEHIGGLVGENYGYVSNCFSTGDVQSERSQLHTPPMNGD